MNNTLVIDCSRGLSSDMLLSAFYDLGIPRNIIDENLIKLDLNPKTKIFFDESKSIGIRGVRTSISVFNDIKFPSRWIDLKALIENSRLNDYVKSKVLGVFLLLAEAEASVHGVLLDEVHFHEIASVESFIEVASIFSIIEFLKPYKVFCSIPPAGSGTVKCSHGYLPVPVPTVLEIARKSKIPLSGSVKSLDGELTTPTGIALLSILSNEIGQPLNMVVTRIGVGLGHRDTSSPNFLRVYEINNHKYDFKEMIRQVIVCQEAWIDDATSEDIAFLTNELRKAGAIEVVCQSINMKKNRQGMSIKALVYPENAHSLRMIWFTKSSTLGFRETEESRWVLPRRKGRCKTSSYGEISFKEVLHPNGELTMKPEQDEVIRISLQTGKSLDQIRKQILIEAKDFISEEDFSC